MPPSIEQLLRPYAEIKLSAFDNMKLLVALFHAEQLHDDQLNAEQQGCECLKLSGIYQQEARDRYCVNWQGVWLDCGWCNDYSAAITAMETPDESQLANSESVTVPLLTLEQVGFMCMQYAHFDHCE
ncbi:hypothetical protein LZP69_00875 [Shewanella sp. AS1]|uniref:hypothetical protein n=1 Tax=Shewanella sp. AS1 TaxID=2907626 RepID=UPI001F26037B|nr:hypothetical protein [Shewanella sp. AS1]MCE9677743.1 hypothetical protein [Shewanella sp. AS1]